MLGELEALYRLGWRGHVDFVDDNLIGNKKAVKAFLPILADWLKARDYPFEFTTEASINLADDAELLELMRAANFFALFVGIESADEETLIATRKKQNTRRDLAESVHRIYAAGMFVVAGFIVGFDAERGPVAPGSAALIEAAAIPICMIGLLWALPNTQLPDGSSARDVCPPTMRSTSPSRETIAPRGSTSSRSGRAGTSLRTAAT
jgi:hypothetical protein